MRLYIQGDKQVSHAAHFSQHVAHRTPFFRGYASTHSNSLTRFRRTLRAPFGLFSVTMASSTRTRHIWDAPARSSRSSSERQGRTLPRRIQDLRQLIYQISSVVSHVLDCRTRRGTQSWATPWPRSIYITMQSEYISILRFVNVSNLQFQ